MPFQKIKCFIYKIGCSIPTLHLISPTPYPRRIRNNRIWVGTLPSRNIFIKAIFSYLRGIYYITSSPHMPFTKMSSRVARTFHYFSHRRNRSVQIIKLFTGCITFARLQITIYPHFSRKPSCCQPNTRRRTHR